MCPVCIATAAIIASSTAGTGGLTAFVATRLLKKSPHNTSTLATTAEEINHGHHSN